jgi:hypothetical protein
VEVIYVLKRTVSAQYRIRRVVFYDRDLGRRKVSKAALRLHGEVDGLQERFGRRLRS